jgi:hypothetical protein
LGQWTIRSRCGTYHELAKSVVYNHPTFPSDSNAPLLFFSKNAQQRVCLYDLSGLTLLFSNATRLAEEGRRSLDFATEFVRGFYAFNALVILACRLVFSKRLLWRRRKRLGKRNPGFFPTYAAAGNALQELQVITQQRVDYVLEEKFDDEADDDDEGEPCGPKKHLHRQLRRIRQGRKD